MFSREKNRKIKYFIGDPLKKQNVIKIKDNFSFHMIQAVVYIDNLNSLNLWESVGPGMHIFKWYKITELSEILREKKTHICFALS